jgi:hypothetical protein
MPQLLSNDRFLNSASPVDTTKPALDDFGHGVWWPLALNEMPAECAQFAAQVYNALKAAQTDEWLAQRRMESATPYALSPGTSNYRVIEPVTWLHEMSAALAGARATYFLELIEAIYTA